MDFDWKEYLIETFAFAAFMVAVFAGFALYVLLTTN